MSNLRRCDDILGSLYWDPTANGGSAVPRVTERDVPYFFLSYSREPGSRDVADFYKSLTAQLVQYDIERRPLERQGFIDSVSIGLGQPWPDSLVDALSTCKVMLAMCSMPYFGSEPCGKEFQVFLDRMRAYQDTVGHRPALLLPIMWVPLKEHEMPSVMSDLQFHTDRLGDTYRDYGLRQLIRVKDYQSAYQRFVFELASIIREVTQQHDLPDLISRPSFHDVDSAFHKTTTENAGPVDTTPIVTRSTRTIDVSARRDVHFVVAAPSKVEVQGIRQELQFYGDWSIDWAPYKPNHASALGEYASDVAKQQNFTSEITTVAGLREQVARAVRTNQIVVLLVDSWAVRLDKYEHALADCENALADHTSVMIPASVTDEESRQYQNELAEKVQQIFGDRNGTDNYWPEVRTMHMFGGALGELLELTTNHLISTGEVYRQPAGDESGDVPTLDGP